MGIPSLIHVIGACTRTSLTSRKHIWEAVQLDLVVLTEKKLLSEIFSVN